EKFGVEISDQEAQTVRTPAGLTRLVISKVEASTQGQCLTQKAFHLVRRRFTEVLHVPRNSVKPDSLLDSFIKRRNRATVWDELRQKTGAASWPALRRPRWVVNALAGLALAVLVLLPAYLDTRARPPSLPPWLLSTLGAIAIVVVGWLGTRPLSIQFSRRTVG